MDPGESVALYRIQISAGMTLICRMAGTVKLFMARTKVSTALCASATPAIGRSRFNINFQPVKAASLSNWDGCRRAQELRAENKPMGQSNRLRIHMVPPSEVISNGNQRLQTPVVPSRSSQQFVTRKGGNAKDRMAIPSRSIRYHRGKPISHNAAIRP